MYPEAYEKICKRYVKVSNTGKQCDFAAYTARKFY